MTIDATVATFCDKLTDACGAENSQAVELWTARNDAGKPERPGLPSPRGVPTTTFRYGVSTPFVKPRPTLSFTPSRNRTSSFRTPVEQAAEVVTPDHSNVCWGAHMSNLARHVIPNLDGMQYVDGDEFEKALGRHLPWFVTIWSNTLIVCGLRDAGGGHTWLSGAGGGLKDQLHVELANAKIKQNDPRAVACTTEYVRLINAGKGVRNAVFEAHCEPNLAAILQGINNP